MLGTKNVHAEACNTRSPSHVIKWIKIKDTDVKGTCSYYKNDGK